jgi:two-component system, cell cycle response regulator CpdR
MARVVLVVDDDALILDYTSSMLEELGCEVITAECGTTALETLATDRRIEVLITDIQMPGMDGYELVAKAQRQRPALQVILCSGQADSKDGLPLIRGRDGCCQPPPAQIRTCPIRAYGSYLECLTAKRCCGHGRRIFGWGSQSSAICLIRCQVMPPC